MHGISFIKAANFYLEDPNLFIGWKIKRGGEYRAMHLTHGPGVF